MKKSLINKEEDKIEKELIKRLEEKSGNLKNKGMNPSESKELKYENEQLVEIDSKNNLSNIDSHFNTVNLNMKESSAIYKQKINLYNEKIGLYNLQLNNNYITTPRKFSKSSSITKYLLTQQETLNNILPLDSKLDLNFSEFFNFRFFKYLDSYSDVLLQHSDLQMRGKLMNVYLFHIINHMMKRKEEIEINNRIEKLIERASNKVYSENKILKEELFINEDEEFLKSYIKESEMKNFAENREEYFEEFRIRGKFKPNFDYNVDDYSLIQDQGFTSPRVLILVPNKKHAKLIVEEIVSITRNGNWKGVSNKRKFKEEFSEAESMNDCFRLGLNFDFFNNKIRLYQSFDESDIIIASPLGLKLTTTNDESVKNKKVFDFLSSIEILLIDFAEVFMYQNIEHLEEILTFMNKIPKNNQNIVSINRIKDSVKNNNLQYLRQNIVISHYKSLEIEMLVKRFCKNVQGGLYVINENYENLIENISKNLNEKESETELSPVSNTIKYEFKMLKTFDDMDIYDYKFNYFTKNVRKIK
jgi:hypothetical protein